MSVWQQFQALTEDQKQEFYSDYKEIKERDLEIEFQDWFNDLYPKIVFGVLEYLPADVLESVDPTGYRQVYLEWLDGQPVLELLGTYYRTEDVEEYLEGAKP